MAVEVYPISGAEMPAVARFLHEQLNPRVTVDAWERAVAVPWKVESPNHGFLLRAGGQVVGACLAFYSERMIDGRAEPFCNLGAWCVHPEYRFHGLRLLKALLAQDGYHFTDLSPSGSVPAINARLGFRFLDTTTALLPALPWPSLPGRQRISSDPAVIDAALRGAERDVYLDHAGAAAARHLVLIRGQRRCHVIFRRDRRKRLPVFASILYVSDPALFRAMARPLARHLLLRHGVLAALVELRVAPDRPRWSVLLGAARKKMFMSASLAPHQIDNLYSELVCVAW